MQLPRLAVDETVVKLEERQVESAADMDALNDLFGIDGWVRRTTVTGMWQDYANGKSSFLYYLYILSSVDGGRSPELTDWYVEYDSSLEWCSDTDEKIADLSRPGEYIVLVERQHSEIEVSVTLSSQFFLLCDGHADR